MTDAPIPDPGDFKMRVFKLNKTWGFGCVSPGHDPVAGQFHTHGGVLLMATKHLEEHGIPYRIDEDGS